MDGTIVRSLIAPALTVDDPLRRDRKAIRQGDLDDDGIASDVSMCDSASPLRSMRTHDGAVSSSTCRTEMRVCPTASIGAS